MKRTSSEIDEFKISWQAYIWEDIDEYNHTWKLHETKEDDEPLIDFFGRNLNHSIVPKYVINGTDLAEWCNVNYFEEEILDIYCLNSIYVFHQLSFYLPALKLTLFQLLGGKVDKLILKDLGFDVDRDTFDWQKFIKEENEDVQLYCSWDGDRESRGFSAKTTKENHLIRWTFPEKIRDFVFDFDAYEKKFKGFSDYLDGYGKFKVKWAKHSKLVTYEEIKDEILFGEYKKYLLGERTAPWEDSNGLSKFQNDFDIEKTNHYFSLN